MAAIRSHFISLFSGAIFPDRKWWLSCFCLPHSKEDKPARQPPPSTERAIYTIQTSHDEEPKTEFRLLSGVEGGASVHEEEASPHRDVAMVSEEAPLANGFKMQLLHQLSSNNHRKDARVSLTEEHDVTASDVDDVMDVALVSVSDKMTTDAEESSSRISPVASLSFHDTVKAFEEEKVLKDIQFSSAADNDRDKVVADVLTGSEEGLALEQSDDASRCLVSSPNPIFAELEENQSSPERQIQSMNASREIRENDIVSDVLSENSDDSKDGLKFTIDMVSTSSSDQSSKISSNLETSGIQSNLSSFEDSFVQSGTCSENGTIMHTSDEESEPFFQFDSFRASSCSSAESTSHDLPHEPIDSRHLGNIPARSKCDESQEMKHGTSVSSQSLGIVLSENTEEPLTEVSCLELSNGISEQKTVLLTDNDTCGAGTQETLLRNDSDQQSFTSEVGRMDSGALLQSKGDVTKDCAISDQLLQQETQNVMDTDVCVPIERTYNQRAQAELETTVTGIVVDRGNSAEIIDISAECTVGQLRPDSLAPDNEETAVVGDESSKCGDGNRPYVAQSNCEVKDQEMDDVVDESMRLNSRLQMKLLFRPNAYETLKYLVDGETELLLSKALEEVLSVRRSKETLHSNERNRWGDFYHCDEIESEIDGMLSHDDLLSVVHQDPFNHLSSKSNVFQEIVIENFEQLFDNEEWLDDDFGFSSTTKSEFQQPPYCDRIIGQQDYSREAFHLRDFELEDDFLPPDFQSPVVQLMPERLLPLVDQATDIFWSRRRYGEPVSAVCPPETYFSVEGHSSDNVDGFSQRSHEMFVFHLVAEMLQEIYSDELTEVPEPWQRVHYFKPNIAENPPTTVDVLKPLLHSRVLQWFKSEKGLSHEMMRKGTGLRKQIDKKDMVDRLLITEMYQEEPSWTDYSQDANMIKNRVANKLFMSLIEDTVQAFKFLQSNALTNKCQ